MLTQAKKVDKDEGKLLIEELTIADVYNDSCRSKAVGYGCTRPSGHTGLHASHYGEFGRPDISRVQAYWVRGE